MFAHLIATRSRLRVAVVSLALIAATVAFGCGLPRLGFDDRYGDLFRADDERARVFTQFSATFDTGEDIALILISGNDVLSRESLGLLRELQQQIRELPAVESIYTPLNARRAERVGRYFLPLFTGIDDSTPNEALDEFRVLAMNHPLVVDRMLSRDRTACIFSARLGEGHRDLMATERALRQMEQVLTSVLGSSQLEWGITGIPAIRVSTIRNLQRDSLLITAAGIVAASLFTWYWMRRFRLMLAVVIPSLVGVSWGLGLMGWAGKNLDAICLVLPALWMVIGISESAHLMHAIRSRRAAGWCPIGAAYAACRELRTAICLAAFTTAVGFGSLMISRDVVIREFGQWASLGVVAMLASVFSLTPLLGASPLGNPGKSGRASLSFGRRRGYASFVNSLALTIARNRTALSAVAIAATVGLLATCFCVRPDYRFSENITDRTQAARTLNRCNDLFGGLPLLQVQVTWPESVRVNSPELLDVLSDAHQQIEASGVARHPTSMLNLLQSLPGSSTELHRRYSELRRLPSEEWTRFIRADLRQTVVSALVPDAGSASLGEPLLELERNLAAIGRAHSGFDLQLTGLIPIATVRADSMIRDLTFSLLTAGVVIFAALSLVFRSLRFGLISIVPNLLPLMATGASIVLFGNDLQYAGVLAFSISLGVAVDDTTHVLARWQRERARGYDVAEAVRRTAGRLMPVLTLTTALMLIGFGATLLSSAPTVRGFGQLSCLALALALLADLIVLPAMILWAFPGVDR